MKKNSADISKIIDIHQNVSGSPDYIHWTDHVKSSPKVFIKPNFTIPFDNERIITCNLVLKELLGIFKDRA